MKNQFRPITRIAGLAPIFLAIAGALPPEASAVEITATASPAGLVDVGDLVTITLSVSNWDQADPEVDGISFHVDFDPMTLEYVADSGTLLSDGSEFLALPNQGPGYMLEDQNDDSLVSGGRYLFGAIDSAEFSAGSLGPDGDVGSFQLRAVAPGTTSIAPGAILPTLVFFDKDLFGITPSGGISFNSVPLVVTSPPGPVTYAGWAAGYNWPSSQARHPEADPDCDGIDNETEYALGCDPLQPDAGKLPEAKFVSVGTRTFLALEYRRPGGPQTRSDLTYDGEVSRNLEAWTRDVTATILSPPDPVTHLELVELRSTNPIDSGNANSREFLRIRLTLQGIFAGP